MSQTIIGDISGGIIDDATAGNMVVGVKCVGRVRPRPGGDVLLPAVAVALRFLQGWVPRNSSGCGPAWLSGSVARNVRKEGSRSVIELSRGICFFLMGSESSVNEARYRGNKGTLLCRLSSLRLICVLEHQFSENGREEGQFNRVKHDVIS